MVLFPNLNENYYVDNDLNILKMMDNVYIKNVTINQSYWCEADIDNRFVANDQNLFSDIYGNMPAYRRRTFNFNHIRKIINMLTGYQRQHRKSTKVTPIEQGSQRTADQFTKLLYHTHNNAHVHETISEAFEGSCIAGMNLLASYLDYRTDPVNGTICVDNMSYNTFLIDPYFKKMDLSDCNNIWIRRFLTSDQLNSLFPSRSDEIKSVHGWGARDGKFQFMPESYAYANQDLIVYDEFYYMTTRKQKLLVDTSTGETIEWKGYDEDLQDFLHIYPEATVLDTEIPTVKLAIVVQGKCLYHGPNPMGIDRYPFTPVWAYYSPEIPYYPWRIQGVVRNLRDAQYLFNRRKVIELDAVESQINSGWIYKEEALVNPKDVFLTGQGKGLAVRRGSTLDDVRQIEPPRIDPSILQLSEAMSKEILEISGINEELLGSAEDDKAGILSMLRQGAGLVTLQKLFDNLDFAQRMLGDLHINIMQNNWCPGKVRRILGEEPEEEFYNRAFLKYDAVVEEAPLTATQKQLALQQRLYLREIGVPIPVEDLLEYVQFTDKDKTIQKIIEQEQAVQQQQAQMQQLQMQQLQVDNETKMSFAHSQHSLAAERMNKVHLDAAVAAEKLRRSDEDKTASLLNLIKAAKEIDSLDLEHFEKAITIVKSMELPEDEEISQIAQSELNQYQQQQQQPVQQVA